MKRLLPRSQLSHRWRQGLKHRLSSLKQQAILVYLVARDPRLGWPLRLLAMLVAAYAFSPIDLIPDFIPIIGLLDDLVLIPLGVALILHLAPPQVVLDAKSRASDLSERPVSFVAGAVVVLCWIAVIAITGVAVYRFTQATV